MDERAGMNTLLMNKMSPAERNGAAALNFLVMSPSQSFAAAGASFTRFGYPAVLAVTAGVALGAAGLSRRRSDGSTGRSSHLVAPQSRQLKSESP
jgi:hypothetical protein